MTCCFFLLSDLIQINQSESEFSGISISVAVRLNKFQSQISVVKMESDAPVSKRSKMDETAETSSPNNSMAESSLKTEHAEDVKRKVAKPKSSVEEQVEPSSSSIASKDTVKPQSPEETDEKDVKPMVTAAETKPTNLLDINNHCLFEILERMDLRDLCSIAEVCVHLKILAQNTFLKKYRMVSLSSLTDPITGKSSLAKVRQLLYNFGPLITSLTIDEDGLINREQYGKLLALVRKYCFETIEEVVFLNHPCDLVCVNLETIMFGTEIMSRDIVAGRYRTSTKTTYKPGSAIQEQNLVRDE